MPSFLFHLGEIFIYLKSGRLNNYMAKQSLITQEGVVVEAMSNALFRVELGNKHEILATISGKMRMHYIRILPGDRVKIEISPYDLTRGRIVLRLPNEKNVS